jgi:hypothetical protein
MRLRNNPPWVSPAPLRSTRHCVSSLTLAAFFECEFRLYALRAAPSPPCPISQWQRRTSIFAQQFAASDNVQRITIPNCPSSLLGAQGLLRYPSQLRIMLNNRPRCQPWLNRFEPAVKGQTMPVRSSGTIVTRLDRIGIIFKHWRYGYLHILE